MEAQDQHRGARLEATSPIKAGSEIYVHYGDTWFEDRGITEIFDLPKKEMTLSELQSGEAQCLSHLYVKESEIPMAGQGVFSKASYAEGDTVYVSPVLVLPKQQVRKHQDSNVLINYCISEEGSDAALLPIGLTGMLNHGGAGSNVRMEWYSAGEEEGERGEGGQTPAPSRLQLPLRDLEALPFAPLDVRYVATRDIPRGQELLLDYGAAWTRRWLDHLDRLLEWNEAYDGEQPRNKALKPQFREPITAPDDFFPEHFKSECIGKASCNESPSLKRRKAFAVMERKRKRKDLYEASKEEMLHAYTGDHGGAEL
jgi:hypothetical protein